MLNENRNEREIISGEIWLNYFNDYALSHGAITEEEHRRLHGRIISRSAELMRRHHISAKGR